MRRSHQLQSGGNDNPYNIILDMPLTNNNPIDLVSGNSMQLSNTNGVGYAVWDTTKSAYKFYQRSYTGNTFPKITGINLSVIYSTTFNLIREYDFYITNRRACILGYGINLAYGKSLLGGLTINPGTSTNGLYSPSNTWAHFKEEHYVVDGQRQFYVYRDDVLIYSSSGVYNPSTSNSPPASPTDATLAFIAGVWSADLNTTFYLKNLKIMSF